MSIVVRVIHPKNGLLAAKRLKKGVNDIAVPRGAHIEVVDEGAQALVKPTSAQLQHGKLVLDYHDGEAVVQLNLSGEQIDAMDTGASLDLASLNAAFEAYAAGTSTATQNNNEGGSQSHSHNSTLLWVLLVASAPQRAAVAALRLFRRRRHRFWRWARGSAMAPMPARRRRRVALSP